VKNTYLKLDSTTYDTAILIGDYARIAYFEKYLDSFEVLEKSREYHVYKCTYKRKPMLISAVGMGAPSLIVAVEEMRNYGIKKFLRSGTIMSLRSEDLGKLVIVEGAVRMDGISKDYVDQGYPAISSYEYVKTAHEVLEEFEKEYISGIICSTGSFYTHFCPGNYASEEVVSKFHENLLKQRVLGLDMETAALLVVSRLLNVQAGTLGVMSIDRNSRKIDNTEDIFSTLAVSSLEICFRWR